MLCLLHVKCLLWKEFGLSVHGVLDQLCSALPTHPCTSKWLPTNRQRPLQGNHASHTQADFFQAPSSVFKPSRCVGHLPSSQRKASLQEERRNLQPCLHTMMLSSLSPRVLSSRHTQVPASFVSNQTTSPFIDIVVLNSSVHWSLVHRLQIQKIHFIAWFKIGSAVSHTDP